MIKVTMEFESIDEALVELSKMVGDVANVVTPKKPPTRKPRNDKGKKRSAYKDPGENPKPSSAAATPETTTPEPILDITTPGAASTPAPTSAEVPPLADCQKAVESLFAKRMADITMSVLAKFGVKRVRDLKEEQRADFIKKANEVKEGGEV